MTEWIGFIAAACTTFAFVPQAIRVWRTHSVEDISLAMYLILVTGIAMWIDTAFASIRCRCLRRTASRWCWRALCSPGSSSS